MDEDLKQQVKDLAQALTGAAQALESAAEVCTDWSVPAGPNVSRQEAHAALAAQFRRLAAECRRILKEVAS
jgi:ABC-type transporter Mla subunit MlaD